jgi:hypothetical protein
VTSAPPSNARTSVSAYHKAETCGVTLPLLRRRRHAERAAARAGAGWSGRRLGLGRGARTRSDHLVLGLQLDEAGRRGNGLRELRAEDACMRLGGRELCAEHRDLVHVAHAGYHTAYLNGDGGVSSGAACRRRTFSCASSATRSVCGGGQSRVSADQGGQRTFPWSRTPRACVGETGGRQPWERGSVSILKKYDIANAGAGGDRPWKEKKKFRAQSMTKRNGRRAEESSHLLCDETRLLLEEHGDVRRDEVLPRVCCACTRSSSVPSGVGEPVRLEGASRRSSRRRSSR